MVLVFILLSFVCMMSNVYLRESIKNKKESNLIFIQSIFVGVFNLPVLFPLSINGSTREKKLQRRANFFLALFWMFFTAIFIVMIVDSY